MKKLVIIIFLVFLLLSANSIWAKNRPETSSTFRHSSPSPTIIRNSSGQPNTERYQKLSLVREYWRRLVNRLETAIARLDKLILRIESRLNKLETEGNDVSGVRADLTRAKST